jgi:hypothetical protein
MTDGTELDYAWLTQNAMRGVVREVLGITKELGALPGEHHFYIEFDTNSHGVGITSALKAQYPERMTIVLQHQFEGLEVEEELFRVVLKFKGVPEMLTIPFAAVTQFADPSASFVLQFQPVGLTEGEIAAEEQPSEDEPTPPEDNPPTGGADVVSLDRFRKK